VREWKGERNRAAALVSAAAGGAGGGGGGMDRWSVRGEKALLDLLTNETGGEKDTE